MDENEDEIENDEKKADNDEVNKTKENKEHKEGRLVSLKIKLTEEKYNTVMKEKRKLDEIENLRHVFISRFKPKAELDAEQSLRQEIREIAKTKNEKDEVEYQGKTYNLKQGKFKVEHFKIVFRKNKI